MDSASYIFDASIRDLDDTIATSSHNRFASTLTGTRAQLAHRWSLARALDERRDLAINALDRADAAHELMGTPAPPWMRAALGELRSRSARNAAPFKENPGDVYSRALTDVDTTVDDAISAHSGGAHNGVDMLVVRKLAQPIKEKRDLVAQAWIDNDESGIDAAEKDRRRYRIASNAVGLAIEAHETLPGASATPKWETEFAAQFGRGPASDPSPEYSSIGELADSLTAGAGVGVAIAVVGLAAGAAYLLTRKGRR